VERQNRLGQRLLQNLQRLEKHLLPMLGVDPDIGGLDRRDAAAGAEIEAPTAELIKHADFLDQAQWMVQRQRIDQRAEAELLRALRDRGEKDARRCGKAKRRRAVFRRVIRIEPAAVIGLHDLQPLLVEFVERQVIAIEVVENAELHWWLPARCLSAARDDPQTALARQDRRGCGRRHGRLNERLAPPIFDVMRELFEDIFTNQPLDPTEAARRAVRPQLRRRFYEQAGVAGGEGAFGIVLDGRPIKTPARRTLTAPTQALAQAIAGEWEAQRDVVDPASMPLTRLANSIIDGVADAPAAVAAEVERYLGSDLVCYRAPGPEGLVTRQSRAWDPVLVWVRDALGARFLLAEGIVFVTQPVEALTAARAAIPRDIWRLGALNSVTTLTGSALIALALAGGALTVDQAWAAAHVDEDWNMDIWGRDALALERRAFRFAEMQAAAKVLQLV
jgi:chaperone required for assembly of F1-ATPase